MAKNYFTRSGKRFFLVYVIACCFTYAAHAQIISTIAGNGFMGYSGDGGPATTGALYLPQGVAIDSSGNVYIAVQDSRIRKVNPAGIITTMAGTGVYGYGGDGGPATLAELGATNDVIADAFGNIYISDDLSYRIRKVSAAGIITTIAGDGTRGYSGDGGPATAADINANNIATDIVGNIYLTESARIRKVDVFGIITTIAGDGTAGYSGDGGPATGAEINISSGGISVDAAGNIYFADQLNYRVREVNTSGIISTFAGNGVSGYMGDGGPATNAEFQEIVDGVWADAAGNVYIADAYSNQRVRMVRPAGIISSIAGNGLSVCNYTGDGGPATAAGLCNPFGIARYGNGNIYFSDRNNNVVRMIAMPAVNIVSSHGRAICAGITDTFRASVSNDASVPQYRWLLNSKPVGTDTSIYITDTLHNGDTVSCVLSYFFGDTITATASKMIIVTVDSFPPKAGAITGADTVCLGNNITLTDTVAGGAWRVTNGYAGVSGGVVSGIAAGMDTVRYTVTNGCGSDSVGYAVRVEDCKEEVAPSLPIAIGTKGEEVLRVFPNPSSGAFTLHISSVSDEAARVVIMNMMGRRVKEFGAVTNKDISVRLDEPAGVYFISVATAEGVVSGKVVIGIKQ